MACTPRDDEHEGYTATNQTWEETLGNKVITWRIYTCQCGARTSDIKDSVRDR